MVNFQLFGLSQNLPVDDITTLDIEYQTEVFASLVNLNNVHKTCGELGVSTDLAVDLDQALFQDGFHFLRR